MAQLLVFRFYDSNGKVDNSKRAIEREVYSADDKASVLMEYQSEGYELEAVFNEGEYE